MRRLALIVLVAGAGAGASAGQASAHAVVSVQGGTIIYNGNDDVSLNTLEVTSEGASYRFLDRGSDGGIQPGGDCTAGDETDAAGNGFIVEVLCPKAGKSALRIDVGEGADKVTVAVALDTVVIGGRGADVVTTSSGVDQVNGGDANDTIATGGGNDTIRGEAGDDTLAGGDGNDTIQASVGIDEANGDAGDDLLQVRDGAVDGVTCGTGSDRVQADTTDVTRDGAACEAVETGEAAAPGTGGGTGTPTTPGSGTTPTTGGTGGTGGTGAGTTGGSVPGSTAGDRTPPVVRSGGSTLQRLTGSRRLTVLATASEAADVVASGTITVGGRRVVLTSASRRIDVAGGGTALRLGIPASALPAIRAALRQGRPVRARITVLATDRAGNSSASRLPSIRLRR